MKRVLITFSLLLLLCSTQAQTVPVIKFLPELTQGYLILHNSPNIQYWDISIELRHYDEQGNFEDEVLETNTLIGKNFIVIPDEYVNEPNHLVTVTAYFNEGDPITEELPISKLVPDGGGNYGTQPCATWTCNGSTYAYSILQYVHNNGGSSYYSVEHAVASSGIPYYQYFSESEWATLTSDNNLLSSYVYFNNVGPTFVPWSNYYEIYNPYTGLTASALNVNGTQIIHLSNNNPNVIYKNAENYPINPSASPTVYGIAKTKGPWCSYYTGNSSCLTKTPITYGCRSQEPLTFAIDAINSNAPYLNVCGMPALECNTYSNPMPVLPPYVRPKPIEPIVKPDSIIPFGSIYMLHTEMGIDLEVDEIVGINLSDISNGTGEIFNLSASEFINEENQIIDFSLELNPGLYTIGYQLADGNYVPLIMEVGAKKPGSDFFSNYLNALIYPNPLVENNYSIELYATKDLSFKYYLTDINGINLYFAEFEIKSNESASVGINPEVEIPSGVLVNTFLFEDGSTKTILTIKN